MAWTNEVSNYTITVGNGVDYKYSTKARKILNSFLFVDHLLVRVVNGDSPRTSLIGEANVIVISTGCPLEEFEVSLQEAIAEYWTGAPVHSRASPELVQEAKRLLDEFFRPETSFDDAESIKFTFDEIIEHHLHGVLK